MVKAVKSNTLEVYLLLKQQDNPLSITTSIQHNSQETALRTITSVGSAFFRLPLRIKRRYSNITGQKRKEKEIKGSGIMTVKEAEMKEGFKEQMRDGKYTWEGGVSSTHEGNVSQQEKSFPFLHNLHRRGVVHSFTAYASDLNTLPPPTSPLPSLPSFRPIFPPPCFLYSMLQGSVRQGGSQKA